MNDPIWVPYVRVMQVEADAVTRTWPDGRQESRLASFFTKDDPDYAAIMALVAEGKLTIAPAEGAN